MRLGLPGSKEEGEAQVLDRSASIGRSKGGTGMRLGLPLSKEAGEAQVWGSGSAIVQGGR